MHIILLMCKLIVFFLSNIGYWEYFRRKSRMNVYFLPAFTISLQVTLLFCAGLLNCLKAAVFLIFAAGIILAVYYLFTDFKETVDTYLNWGYVSVIAAFCLVMIACKGQKFMLYDDFSHWALSVKNMLLTDRYPSFRDNMIVYQEYPLGSTSYIYFFAKIVAISESAQMVAQNFMMLCFILPIFKYLEKYKAAGSIYIFLFVKYIFSYSVPITGLMVDTLLPLMGMGTLLFIYSECMDKDGYRDGRGVSTLYAIPFLCAVVQVKNTGIYFVMLACILFYISIRHSKVGNRQKMIAMLAPFLSIYFWHTHCNYVFSDFTGLASKHAMTIQNYQTVFAEKTWGDIQSILLAMLKFSIGGIELYHLILFAAVTGGLSFLAGAEVRSEYGRLFFVCAAMYVTYMVGTAGMYLFSMPGPEAANLAGSARYRSTIFIAIYYLLAIFSFKVLSSIEMKKKEYVCLAGMFLTLITSLIILRGYPSFFGRSAEKSKVIVEQAIEDNHVPVGTPCVILAPSQLEATYMWLVVRYLLWTDDVSSVIISEKSQLDNIKDCEYILNCDLENKEIQEWIEDNYPEQKGKSAIIKKF